MVRQERNNVYVAWARAKAGAPPAAELQLGGDVLPTDLPLPECKPAVRRVASR